MGERGLCACGFITVWADAKLGVDHTERILSVGGARGVVLYVK